MKVQQAISIRVACLLLLATLVSLESVSKGSDALPQRTYNVPSLLLGDRANIGGNTVLNVADGGLITDRFDVYHGGTLNVTGGEILSPQLSAFPRYFAWDGATVNISGGVVAGYSPLAGSTTVLSGGAVAGMRTSPGSNYEIRGGDFRLNGVPYAGSNFTSTDGDIFTGVLADGSPFVAWDETFSSVSNVTLSPVALPPIEPSPILVDGANIFDRYGLRPGESLTVLDGGDLGEHFTVVDAEIDISGGSVGSIFSVGSQVTLSQGAIRGRLTTLQGSTTELSGGSLLNLVAGSGSSVTISGGRVGELSTARSGSVLMIEGGIVGPSFRARSGSTVLAGGGWIDPSFRADSGAAIDLRGGMFQLNNLPYTDPTVALSVGDLFTGVLADGSAFVLSGSSLLGANMSLQTVPLPVVDTTPLVVEVGADSPVQGLRDGQALTVRSGGSLGEFFNVFDSTLHIEGGIAGRVDAVGSTVNIGAGEVSGNVALHGSSSLSMSGGSLGGFAARDGSTVTISGGTVGRSEASAGSQVQLDGGSVSNLSTAGMVRINGGQVDQLRTSTGSDVVISDGSVGVFAASGRVEIRGGVIRDLQAPLDDFGDLPNPEIRLVGSDFRVGDHEASGSVSVGIGEVLSGVLEDGTPFLVEGSEAIRFDYVSYDLSVDLVPAQVPIADPTPMIVNGQSLNPVRGLRSGQTLTVQAGAELPDPFVVVDATLNFEGGVTNSLRAIDSHIAMSGGAVESGATFYSGNSIELSGGAIGGTLVVHSGNTLTISGGAAGNQLAVADGATLNLVGSQFRLNGVEYEGQTVQLTSEDSLSGILADGTPLFLSDRSPIQWPGTFLPDGITIGLSRVETPAYSVTPITVDVDNPASVYGLRSGQKLTVHDGGELVGTFTAVDSSLHVEGGTTGRVQAIGSELVVSGGHVNGRLHATDGSVVTVSGGHVGPSEGIYNDKVVIGAGSVLNVFGGEVEKLTAESGSVVNVSGGVVDSNSDAEPGSTFNVSGGLVGGAFDTIGAIINISGGKVLTTNLTGSTLNVSGGYLSGFQLFGTSSTINVSGGTIDSYDAGNGGNQLNFFGVEFYVDGELIDLELGQTHTILDSDALIEGVLADGGYLSKEIERFGSITLTKSADTGVLIGDFNGDGLTNAADYSVWRDEAGGLYTAAHRNLWQAGYGWGLPLSGSTIRVPEPACFWSVLLATAPLHWHRRCCRRG